MRHSIMFCLIVAILLAISIPVYAQLPSGLILYYSFDKANGDKVPDLSAGKHDGTLKAGAKITTTAKYGGGALEITPQDASMEVEPFKEMNEYNDNTFIFWIYFTAGSNGAWSQVLAKLGSTDRNPGIWINPDGLGFHYRFDAGNKGMDKIGPGGEGKLFAQKTWYHVAGVKKGAELTFYVDKKAERVVADAPAKSAQGAGKLYVGKSAAYRAATFIIDDLAVFNRALSAAEIASANGSILTAVAAKDKLSTAWGEIKSH